MKRYISLNKFNIHIRIENHIIFREFKIIWLDIPIATKSLKKLHSIKFNSDTYTFSAQLYSIF